MTNDNAPVVAWQCFGCKHEGELSLCRKADGSHAFETLAAAYLVDVDDESETRHQAYDCVGEMVINAPEAALGFLVVALAQCRDVRELCVLAAGPLEDVLEAHGPRVIGKLEQLAKVDPKFRLLLSGTWGQPRIDEDVWARLVAAVAPGPVVDADGRTPGRDFPDKIVKPHELTVLFAKGAAGA
jgi:hypothetical protein